MVRWRRFKQMARGGVALVACATVLVTSVAGQQADDSVVILASGDSAPYRDVAEGFRRYLGKHHPEATVSTIILSDANRPQVFDGLERKPPSVILTLGGLATRLVLTDVSDIPVVAAMVLDMDAVVKAPNATGVSLEFSLETSLTWLMRILPGHESVGVLYDPIQNEQTVKTAQRLASDFDLTLESETVTTPRDLRSAMEQLARRSDVLWGIPDQTVLSPQTAQQVLLFSFREQIPFVGLSAQWVKAGALYSLDRDYKDLGAQSGGLVVKILRGTPPRALPPQTPRTVVYDVNLRTAEQMRITLSAEVLADAREVIR